MILFVSGTGTSVGKTVVACALVKLLRRRGLKVGVCKPVATGAVVQRGGGCVSSDAVKLIRAAGMSMAEHRDVNPALFIPPVSPHLAARLAGKPLSLQKLRQHIYNMERRYDILVVEGIGGVATPLTDRTTWADFLSGFRSPKTMLVCSPNLGTLNHTLLSLEYLERRSVQCGALVLSKYDPSKKMHRLNRLELGLLTGIPVGICSGRRILNLPEKILFQLIKQSRG